MGALSGRFASGAPGRQEVQPSYSVRDCGDHRRIEVIDPLGSYATDLWNDGRISVRELVENPSGACVEVTSFYDGRCVTIRQNGSRGEVLTETTIPDPDGKRCDAARADYEDVIRAINSGAFPRTFDFA